MSIHRLETELSEIKPTVPLGAVENTHKNGSRNGVAKIRVPKVHFEEGPYTVRELDFFNPRDRQPALHLRVKVFGEELGWVDPVKEAEGDKFDPYCYHFGISRRDDPIASELTGYVRFLKGDSPVGLMIEDPEAFRPLIDGSNWSYNPRRTLELSRLAVASPVRNAVGENGFLIEDSLYKAVYHKAVALGLEQWVLEVEPKFYIYLRRHKGFLFRKFGEHTFCEGTPKATRTYAAEMNLRETVLNLIEVDPRRILWMSEGLKYIPELDELRSK